MLNEDQIADWNNVVWGADFNSIISFAKDKFGNRLVVTSSFRTQSLPLLHLLSDGQESYR